MHQIFCFWLFWIAGIKFTGFSAQGKIFHFNETKVSVNFPIILKLTPYHTFLLNKVNHYQANEYCQQRGLQLATLKAVADVETVATKLKNLNAIGIYKIFWG